jgi:hypothetical protein
VEVSCQIHASAALFQLKEVFVAIEQEAECPREQVWTLLLSRRESNLSYSQ